MKSVLVKIGLITVPCLAVASFDVIARQAMLFSIETIKLRKAYDIMYMLPEGRRETPGF